MKKENIRQVYKQHRWCMICLSILLFFLIGTIVLLCVKKESYSSQFKITVGPMDNFVFLGDSITDFYPLEEYYDELPVINSGIAGNKTTDILNDMTKRVYQYNPTKVFLLIGTNDLNEEDMTAEKVVKNIKKIVSNIKTNRSRAKIYIESIYPVTKEIANNQVDRRDNQRIKEVNRLLETICKEEGYTYIDLYSKLSDDKGNLKSKYTTDGLHLNSLGYVVVTRELSPYLND